MITASQLQSIMPHVSMAKVTELLPFLTSAMAEFEIGTPARAAAFLAQLAHESGEFRFMEEIWGPTDAQRRYEPVTSLSQSLGNTEGGDGKRFKGRGPIQLTGRANYRRFGDLLGVDLVADPPRAALPDTAFRVAGLFWSKNGLNQLADDATTDSFTRITKRINGGINGLAERQAFYAVARRVLDVANVPTPRARTRSAPAIPADAPVFERGMEAIRSHERKQKRRPAKSARGPPARGAIVRGAKKRTPTRTTKSTRKRTGTKPHTRKK